MWGSRSSRGLWLTSDGQLVLQVRHFALARIWKTHQKLGSLQADIIGRRLDNPAAGVVVGNALLAPAASAMCGACWRPTSSASWR
jgi:hypothetical protein